MQIRTLIPGFLLLISLSLAAQEQGKVLIYQSSGADFSLTVRGERKTYSPGGIDSGGLTLSPQDLIQTGSGAFVEMQLLPSGTLIKISENTTFMFNGFDSAGRFADFGLLYGRMRLVSGTGEGNKTAVVRSANISVRIEEGDLGIDYVLEPLSRGRGASPRPQLRLYGFRGGAEVFPFPSGGSPVQAGEIQSLSVRENETLTLEITSPVVYTERKALGKDIIDFWDRHNFAGIAPLTMPSIALPKIPGEAVLIAGPAEVPHVPDNPVLSPDYSAFSRARRVKNTAIITGLVLTAAAAAAAGTAYSRLDTDNDTFARNLFAASSAPLGVGIITILTGIIYNPRIGSP